MVTSTISPFSWSHLIKEVVSDVVAVVRRDDIVCVLAASPALQFWVILQHFFNIIINFTTKIEHDCHHLPTELRVCPLNVEKS